MNTIQYNPRDELQGGGFFDYIKRGATALGNFNNYLKNSKAISKTGYLIADVTGHKGVRAAADTARLNGYGKRKGKKPGPKRGSHNKK